MVEEKTTSRRGESIRMRDIAIWNILAIVCLGLPAFFMVSACTQLLTTRLYPQAIGLIFLIFLVFAVLVGNVVTLWKEDKEESQ